MIEYVNVYRVPAQRFPEILGELLGEEGQRVVDPKNPHILQLRASTGRLRGFKWDRGGVWLTVASTSSEDLVQKLTGPVRWVEVLDASGGILAAEHATHCAAEEGILDLAQALSLFGGDAPYSEGNAPYVVEFLSYWKLRPEAHSVRVLKGYPTWQNEI